MIEQYDTILRCLGYALDFTFAFGPVLGLGGLTWSITR